MGPWVPMWIIPQGTYRNEETPIITRTVTVIGIQWVALSFHGVPAASFLAKAQTGP